MSDTQKLHTILLVTAAIRLRNLPRIAKSITEGFAFSRRLSPHWLIILDKAHADTSDPANEACIASAASICIAAGVRISFVRGGDNTDKPNYGGDMYNRPLFDEAERRAGADDPLVYILDDDNVVHPLLAAAVERTDLDTRHVIWLSMLRQRGVLCQAEDTYAWTPVADKTNGGTVVPMEWLSDPSQLVFRLSHFVEMGGFHRGSDYDYVSLPEMFRRFRDEYVFYPVYDGWHKDKSHAYHNGLRSLDDFEWYGNVLECKSSPAEAHLCAQGDDGVPLVFPVPRRLAAKWLDELKRETFPEIFSLDNRTD